MRSGVFPANLLFPREESNLHLQLRKLESCPLNDRGISLWTLQELNL